ncbi:kinesin, partial [Helicosporidium sp. ATCC 50920]
MLPPVPSPADRVRVYVRVRPRMDEDGSPNAVQLHPDGRSLTIQRENRATAKFEFDGVLPPSASQADVYSCAVAPIVADVLAGYNGTVMAYGQTGAGKTYTLSSMSQNSIGMIPRAAAELFAALARDSVEADESVEMAPRRFASPPLASRQPTQQSDSSSASRLGDSRARRRSASRSGSEEGSIAPRLAPEAEHLDRLPPRTPASRPGEVEHTVLLSYIQIYQEAVQDLLCPESENLSIRESEAGVFVWGAQQREVSSLEQCLALVRAGDANRATAFTALNAASSRSHAVVMFTVISRRAIGEAHGSIAPAADDLLDPAGV